MIWLRAAVAVAPWLLLRFSPWPGSLGSVAVAIVVVLFVPGWAVSRLAARGGHGRFGWLESPATWLTLSVGATGTAGLVIAILGLPLDALILVFAILSAVAAMLGPDGEKSGAMPAQAEESLPDKSAVPDERSAATATAGARSTGPSNATERSPVGRRRADHWLDALGGMAIVAVALGYAWMASNGDNIARDRMWYLAYITSLADHGGPIDWSEPLLGTGHVVARFAYNAWTLTLALLTRLSKTPAPYLFERTVPMVVATVIPAAAFALGRAVLATPRRAALATLTTLLIVLTTRYPFFSPDRYVGFGRLAEDKTVALLVFYPTVLAIAVDLLAEGKRPRARGFAVLAVAAAALALSHPIVYLLALVVTAAFGVLAASGSPQYGSRSSKLHLHGSLHLPATPWRRVAAVGAVLALVSIVPGVIGWQAREQIGGGQPAVSALGTSRLDPVVRAHLRMGRLVELPVAGPVTNPRLIAEPVLVVALIGLIPVLVQRRTRWGKFLLASSLPMLALAFMPLLSPAFGRLIVPWMAYRALWGVPFGLLLAVLLLEGPSLLARAGSKGPQSDDGDICRRHGGPSRLIGILSRTGLAAVLLVVAAPKVPWQRIFPLAAPNVGLEPDLATRELLAVIAKLPARSRLAAASGLAELIPAYTGHPVLAFSDRGTAVFSGTREDAARRLEANALLIGLHGVERGLRNRIVGFYDVTNTIYENRRCDRRAAPIFRNERFTLCAERKHEAVPFHLAVYTAVAGPVAGDPVVASMGNGITCRPPPSAPRGPARYRWRRMQRWSGEPVAVTCQVALPHPMESLRLRVEASLPRAREVLVYRVAARTSSHRWIKRRGGLEFRGNPYGELWVPGKRIDAVRFRLVPAYLPYLNLIDLELIAPGHPSEPPM